MFNPARLSLARRRRGRTQIGLAEALGVTRLTIYRYERGESDPPPEMLERIAAELSFPVAFFAGGDFDEPNEESASFRGLTAMTAKERDSALGAGALAFLLDDWVRERFDLPSVALPDLAGEAPEIAARGLRQEWGLGERPVKHMIRLLEAKGARVFSLSEDTSAVDAFSLWRSGKPYVFLNTQKTAERSRFDAAHELGHLVMHKHGGPQKRSAEDEANQFASELLMPAADVIGRMPKVSNVQQIIARKSRWGVSAFALNYRLYRLKCTSEYQYKQFAIQLTRLGYRTGEPLGMAPEKSVVWQKVLTALWQERITKNQVAEAIAIPPFEIEALLFRVAPMMTLEGGATQSSKSQARLTLLGSEDTDDA